MEESRGEQGNLRCNFFDFSSSSGAICFKMFFTTFQCNFSVVKCHL